MPTAYSYVRFSTPEQMKGDSFRRQSQMSIAYAELNNLELCDDLSLFDEGVSAYRQANSEHGALGVFISLAKEGYIERGSYLLLESLDRLSRDEPFEAMTLLREICKLGITVVTLMDNKIYNTEIFKADPFAGLMSMIIMTRAYEESETKSRRLLEAWSQKRKKAGSKPLTSVCPGWLQLNKQNECFEVIPERAEIISRIFKETLSGIGQHRIVKSLNEESVKPFGRAQFWHRSYIAKILANRAVIGEFQPHRVEYQEGKRKRVPHGAVIKDYYPTVIEEEDFIAVTALKATSLSPIRGRHAANSIKNVLSGIGVCPQCDSSMIRSNKGKKSRPKLICSRAKTGGGCVYHSVDLETVEHEIRKDWSKLIEEVPIGVSQDKNRLFVDRLEGAIRSAEQDADRLIDLLMIEDSALLRTRLAKKQRRISRYGRFLQQAYARLVDTSNKLEQKRLGDLNKIGDPMTHDVAELNAILRRVVSKVIVDYDRQTLVFVWLEGKETTELLYGWPSQG